MVFKPIGVDADGSLPPRVVKKLDSTYLALSDAAEVASTGNYVDLDNLPLIPQTASDLAAAYQPATLPDSIVITNSTTTTTVVSVPFDGNDLTVGDVVQASRSGTFTNTTGAPVTVAPSVVYSTSAAGEPGSFDSSVSPYGWRLEIVLIVTGLNSQRIQCRFTVDTPTGQERWVTEFVASQDLTTDSALKFSITLGTASANAVFAATSGWTQLLPSSVQQVAPVLWFADYDSVGPAGSSVVQGVWYREQEPNYTNPDTNRITIVPPASVPGSGKYKPIGNALRVDLHPYSATNPGTDTPPDGDDQGPGYNRAECYDRVPLTSISSTPAEQWPDPVGSERWYGYSVFFPVGHVFATDSSWFTLTQCKGQYGSSPPIAIELYKQQLRFGGTRGPHAPGYNLQTITPGTWLKLVFGVKWATDSTGWVNVFLNDVEKIPKFAMQTMDLRSGTTTADPIYLKQGIYRTKGWAVTHTLHFGNMVVGRKKADVENKLSRLLSAS